MLRPLPPTKHPVVTPTIKYHPEDNAAYMRFSEAKILESAKVAPDVVFDYTPMAELSALNC